MSSTRHQDHALDDLIAEITIDCYDEDEQLQAFENAFDEDAALPCAGSVVGVAVSVLRVGQAGNRELVATCRRDERSYEVALLDIDIGVDDPATARLLAAYRRWISL
jgi:hypothetical protein